MINKLHQRPVPRFEPFPREMMDKCLFPCGCTQDETGFRFFFFLFLRFLVISRIKLLWKPVQIESSSRFHSVIIRIIKKIDDSIISRFLTLLRIFLRLESKRHLEIFFVRYL